MWSAIGVPTSKAPIIIATLVSYVLPPVLFYFVMAVLAITPQTRALRVALWPVIALLALRTSMDMALSDFERKFHNGLAGHPMLLIVTRSLHFALAKEPLVRRLRPVNSTPSTLMDAFDLALTFRSCDWDWSRGLYIPPKTRPSNRTEFVSHVALSTAAYAFICGVLHLAIRSFSPAGPGSISGWSIFDETLPPHLRYLRSSIISIVGCFATYTFLQTGYHLCTIVGVLVLGQDPAQWPPGFDSPWRSTSLTEFWGRRWHQWPRHIFLVQAGYPLSFIFGRAGLVIGGFLSSAANHHVGLSSLDSTSKLWRMLLGFGMMVPGMFAERAFKQLTGRKVCGLAGWVWTMTWLVLWGNVLMDGFMRAGLFRAGAFTDGVPPLQALVERLVMCFDTWLHAV
ncbi:hypothetical protein HD554DRAFT_458450 [Boletus coccyginus]|nr:hypothetical protein HD554DRAFT_458450 [Boletus coccyginus]